MTGIVGYTDESGHCVMVGDMLISDGYTLAHTAKKVHKAHVLGETALIGACGNHQHSAVLALLPRLTGPLDVADYPNFKYKTGGEYENAITAASSMTVMDYTNHVFVPWLLKNKERLSLLEENKGSGYLIGYRGQFAIVDLNPQAVVFLGSVGAQGSGYAGAISLLRYLQLQQKSYRTLKLSMDELKSVLATVSSTMNGVGTRWLGYFPNGSDRTYTLDEINVSPLVDEIVINSPFA